MVEHWSSPANSSTINRTKVVFPGEKKPIAFNHVFDITASQRLICEEAVTPLVDNLFRGLNATSLAYGQTGSGKTYTMGTVLSGNDTN